ncbi:MAG: EamA family transporter [Ignavibacteriales bacterium]|nr:MAG: EamA family transporter [Ignavibacteriales bacterium]
MTWFILAFTSAVLSAAASLGEKKSLFKMSAINFSFVLSLFTLLFSIPFFLSPTFQQPGTTSLIILFAKTLLNSFAFLFVMYSIKNLDISEALPLMVLTPGFVAIFAFIFLGESLTLQEISGVILLLVGTYILETGSDGGILGPFKVFIKTKNYRFVITALLLFTITSILDKVLVGQYKVTPHTFVGYQHLFTAIIFLITFLFNRRSDDEKLIPEKSLLGLIVVIAVITIGYRYTQIEAVKLAPVALVLSVKRISVFFATLAGGKIFKEKNLLKKAIATAVMIAGALLILEE